LSTIERNKKEPVKSEAWEQTRLAAYLNSKGYHWFHVPNGEHRHKAVAMRLKSHGVSPGVPDCIIVGQPMIAIELKRTKGGTISKSQKEWKKILEDNGWVYFLARGSQAAIEWLESR
tara:strand:+ start:256 stop:606 length:351 start_codon:yes stop_codon:yes gene_type:complete